MSDLCRLCSAPLRGSRRKWLFGGSGTLPALFSQALGTNVQRSSTPTTPKSGKGKGQPEDAEFLCGKCCHTLNVYHRYDLVVSRMKELFEQRSIHLLKEQEKLSFTLRTLHARSWGLPLPDYHGHERNSYGYHGSYNDLRSPGNYRSRNSSLSPGYQSSFPNSPFPDHPSSYHGSFSSLSSGTHSKCYQELLDQDRSHWVHESWWDTNSAGCSRCVKGKKCHSCSSWRVSDANYESVCTVPRRKKQHGGSDSGSTGLQRSKSLGSFNGGSTKGSLSSLSTTSLDSLCFVGEDEAAVFWEPHSSLPTSPPEPFHSPKPVVGEVLKSLKEIKYSPVKTPTRCKIPVRDKQRPSAEYVDQQIHVYKGPEEPVVEGLGEDWDAFMGIGPKVCRTQVSGFHRIRDTLNWLQTQLKAAQNGGTLSGNQDYSSEQQEFVRELIRTLRFKEELLEDCLTLLLTLPMASDSDGDLITDFVEKLRVREDQTKKEGEELAESNRQRDAEIHRLQEEMSAREADITRLTKVLRENQDTMLALRDLLGEKDFTIQHLEVALDSAIRSAASQDTVRLAALREKDALITAVQAALSSSNQDVEALADSLLSQGLDDLGGSLPGLSAPNPLLAQLQEKGRLLSQAHTESQKQSVQHQKDIQDLLNALNECQTLLQEQLRHCKSRLQDASQEKKTLRETLLAKEAELRTEKQRHNSALGRVQTDLLTLHDSARERDQATKKLLLDAHSRDQTIKKLQEKLILSVGMRDTL